MSIPYYSGVTGRNRAHVISSFLCKVNSTEKSTTRLKRGEKKNKVKLMDVGKRW